jgi:diguanylate cyclase (GGDEF)-like protein/PAS domain S-box-containing protein
MRYKWRLILSLTVIIFNIFGNFSSIENFSFNELFSLIINGGIGWIIGFQIDKYRYSKKELGTTKTVLLDYSYALDSVGEAIGIFNEKGQFEFVNGALTELYGYTKEEFLTLNWRNCYDNETIDHLNSTALPKLLKAGHWKGESIGLRKDGTVFPQEISLSLMKQSQNTICVVRDITEQKSYEEYMKYTAEHNDLTNLPNRRRLLTDLTLIKKSGKGASLFFIDLDRFKLVNDNYGHDAGDELLKNVAKRLTAFRNEHINVYHHGGDEFIVIIQNTNVTFLKNLALSILNSIKESYFLNGIEVFITASIGISLYPNHTSHIIDLIKSADTAMYYAKLEGKNTYKFFNKELEMQQERKTMIEAELRKAIKNEELLILYQPKFQLDRIEIIGIEALVRWEHPVLGLVSPEEFIPVAEETGLIIEIGNWVIHDVLHQMQKWQEKGYPCLKVSVNVSPRQFRDKELVRTIQSSLQIFNIDSCNFEIEITESVLADPELAIPILNSLKKIGVGISIDDFGTGYSSLNILKDLPIDTLKIDQSFIRDLFGDPKDNLLVMTIIEIGHILGLKVVAEGIETEQQLNHLLLLNCRIGQGFYFSKPVKAAELENRFFMKRIS